MKDTKSIRMINGHPCFQRVHTLMGEGNKKHMYV